MRATEEYLASVIDDVDRAWAARYRDENKLPHVFDENVTGALDTFPVYISRPSDSWLQKKTYNGKYGTIACGDAALGSPIALAANFCL